MTDFYNPGESVHCSATFAPNGTPTDPGTVTFNWQGPDGTIATLVYGTDVEVVKQSTGVYYVDLVVTTEGRYSYRFTGTDPAPGSAEGTFIVTTNLVQTLEIMQLPGDYDAVRALLGVEPIDLGNEIIELPTYGPAIESRVKSVIADWATLQADGDADLAMRNACIYGCAAMLAESYMKGGTVSLVHSEQPRRNWSEWARIFWNRYEEWLARVVGDPEVDEPYDIDATMLAGPTRSRGEAPDWDGIYPPVWPE